MSQKPLLKKPVELEVEPQILHQGRPFGSGINIITLKNMQPGQWYMNIPLNKMNSLRQSSYKARPRIKLRVRRLPNGLYGFKRL